MKHHARTHWHKDHRQPIQPSDVGIPDGPPQPVSNPVMPEAYEATKTVSPADQAQPDPFAAPVPDAPNVF